MPLSPEKIELFGAKPDDIHSVRLDLTTDCNLRCVYCTRSQPGYKVVNMTSKIFAAILSGIGRYQGIEFIEINGHGETTAHPKWRSMCELLFKENYNVSITSNFAKIFDPFEINLLSRFTSILISMDSSDRELLRSLRRKVDLRTILLNMTAVRARALKNGRRPPVFGLSCGLYDQSVMGIEDLARFAVVMGVKNIIFWNLTKHRDLPDVVNPQPLDVLSDAELVLALARIDGAEKILREFGIAFHYAGDFMKRLRDRAAGGEALPEPGQVLSQAGEKMTRCCTNPWRHVEFSPQGGVAYCCNHPTVGSLEEGSLESIRNNERSKKLRLSLLTGDLDPHCRKCTEKKMMPVTEFLKRFEEVEGGSDPAP